MENLPERDNNSSKDKRGRPVGSKNKSAKFENYNPKRWHPEFDLFVIESVSGKSNEEIGRLHGYTAQHISNILSTPQAREIKERIRSSINTEFETNLKERFAKIGEKAIRHIESFIEDENSLASKSPFMFVDRVVRIGQVVGSLGSENGKNNPIANTTINGNVNIMTTDQAKEISEALRRSKELDSVEIGDTIKDRDVLPRLSKVI